MLSLHLPKFWFLTVLLLGGILFMEVLSFSSKRGQRSPTTVVPPGSPCPLEAEKLPDYRRICLNVTSNTTFSDSGCPLDDHSVDVCCYCFESCCENLEESIGDRASNIGLNQTTPYQRLQNSSNPTKIIRNESVSTEVKVISLPRTTESEKLKGNNRNRTSITESLQVKNKTKTEINLRTKRSSASKSTRGTGSGGFDDEDEGNRTGTITIHRKDLEVTIENAVRIALYKLASTLKNVTAELEEERNSTQDQMYLSTLPPVESCSSKSKKCDDQEPDLLDEFFPPRNLGNNKPSQGNGRSRRDLTPQELRAARLNEIKANDVLLRASGGIMSDLLNNHLGMDLISTSNDDIQPGDDQHGGGKQPTLVSTSIFVPSVKPGDCPTVPSEAEIVTQPSHDPCITAPHERIQHNFCVQDGDCDGPKKCCFKQCNSKTQIGFCSLPIMFS